MRAAWMFVALAACKSGHKTEGSAATSGSATVMADMVTGGGNSAETRFGPPNPGGDRELAFAITAVYKGQAPSATPPYHVAGGTWTYFDARLTADPAATFAVGMPELKAGSDGFGGFSKIWLVPSTPDAGGHFVAAFARAFHVAAPAAHPGTLAPLEVPIAVLGVKLDNAGNGYSGAGTWDATKLFLSNDDVDSAELFFNVSLADRQGVFSEKDESYDADDARVLADALRDGRPPPRTPENDPTLGPRQVSFDLGKRVASRDARLIGQSAERALLTDMLDDHSVLIAVDLATGDARELYTTKAKLYDGVCDAAAQHCLLHEIYGKDRHSYSSNEPASVLVLDGDKVAKLAVAGGGTHPSPKAISPGGRFAIVNGDRVVIIVDRKTHTSLADHDKDYREIIAWRGETVAVVSREDILAPDAKKQYAAWHLDTGKLDPIASAPPRDDATSPDGARTIAFDGGKVTVTPRAAAPRTLQLDPRDARYAEAGCCKWLDSRYVAFRTRTFGVFDTDAMKVAFIAPPPDDERVDPVPGSLRAFVTKGEDMFLARIVP